MRISWFLIVLLVPVAALAAENGGKPDYCRYLPAHQPAADVEYQPGVDMHGEAVVPADINQSINIEEEDIVIPVEVDLVERFNLDLADGLKLDPAVGALSVKPDGQVYYNGRDITGTAAALCGAAEEAAGDGQKAVDGLVSDVLSEPTEGQ